MFTDAVKEWDEVLKVRSIPRDAFDAAETRLERGSLLVRLGDARAAEVEFGAALALALGVLNSAYEQTQAGGHDNLVVLGRAAQIYADAALNIAVLYGNPAELKGAHALAREALRLRPQSYRARYQVGIANL